MAKQRSAREKFSDILGQAIRTSDGDLQPSSHMDQYHGSAVKMLSTFYEIHREGAGLTNFIDVSKNRLSQIEFGAADIRELCKGIEVKMFSGVFISMAVKKIIQPNQAILLELEDKPINYMGISLEQGKLVIAGDCGDYAGFNMSGGKLHIKGNVGLYAGSGMSDGELKIDGNTGRDLGSRNIGTARIYVKGDIGSILPRSNPAIYNKWRKVEW